jgi:hypothetical protein
VALILDTTPPRVVDAHELACGECRVDADLTLRCDDDRIHYRVASRGGGHWAVEFRRAAGGHCEAHDIITRCPARRGPSVGFTLANGARVVADPTGAMR